MTGVAYAVGKYAWAQCGKCGLRFRYLDMVSDGQWRHLRVCRGCYDPRHPQERLTRVSDPVALYRPTTECNWPPEAPVLSGVLEGTTGRLTWTAARSPDSAIAGYRLFRTSPDADQVQIADLQVQYSWIRAIEFEPLSYDDPDLALGAHEYVVYAYDLRGFRSPDSNIVTLTVTAPSPDPGVYLDVIVGDLSPGYPYGYEMDGFILGNPPLYGNTDPYPPVVDGSTMYAAWSHPSNGGFEMWWSAHLPTNCSTLRVHTSSGFIDLDFINPTDKTDLPEGQSYIYWADVQPWTEADVGITHRIEFLE